MARAAKTRLPALLVLLLIARHLEEEPMLFEMPALDELTPGMENRIATRRRKWVMRQRRSRARRKLEAQSEAMRESNFASLLGEREMLARFSKKPDHWWTLFAQCHYWTWGAILIGGKYADRVFEVMSRDDFPPPVSLLFEAAQTIHQRGGRVTRTSLEAQLKRDKVIILQGTAWLDDIFKRPDFPKELRVEDIDDFAAVVKQA